jgi:hypothetical protein
MRAIFNYSIEREASIKISKWKNIVINNTAAHTAPNFLKHVIKAFEKHPKLYKV